MRFTFVLLLWRFCGGVAAAAPENKNPPVRIASGGCVVSDVKGGAGGSRFGCRYLYVRIPISEGGRRRFCIVPSVAEGLLVVVFFPNEVRISLCGPSVAAPVSFAVPAPCAAPVSCRGPCSACGRRRCADGGRGYLRGSFRSGPKLAGAILHSGRSSDSFPAVRLPDRRVSGVVHDITSAEAELTAASTVPASHRIPF